MPHVTEEKLVSYGVPGGPAIRLSKAIQHLLHPEASVASMENLWKSLLEGKYETIENDLVSVVKLPDKVQWLTEKSPFLFVRKCDRDLYDIVRKLSDGKPEKGIVITGNPGIGKSWFLSYCLLNLAQEQKTVFFESVSRNKAWLFNSDGSVNVFAPITSLAFPSTITDDANSIYLFDPAGKDPREPRQVSAFTVVTASPDPRHYQQFNKRIGNKKYYMPCWTRDEITSILSCFPNLNQNTVESRVVKYGGIPRYVLTETDDWHPELEKAISGANLDDLQKSVGGPEVLPAVSHKLLHYDPIGYVDCAVRFASPYIADRISNKLLVEQTHKAIEFLQRSAHIPTLASVRGSLFENYAHSVLQGNGTWVIHGLTCDKKDEQLKLQNNNQTVVFESLDKLTLSKGVYYKPKSKRFGALDSLARLGTDIYLFQMTVSQDHSISHAALKEHLETLIPNNPSCKFTLIFVTPPDMFKKIGKQSYLSTKGKVVEEKDLAKAVQSVEQWVMALPLTL